LPRTASVDDSREWRGWRQANIAIIHSDPQGFVIASEAKTCERA
jgi:hypothetical protein